MYFQYIFEEMQTIFTILSPSFQRFRLFYVETRTYYVWRVLAAWRMIVLYLYLHLWCDRFETGRLQNRIENDDSVSCWRSYRILIIATMNAFVFFKLRICQTNKQIIHKMLNDFLWFDEDSYTDGITVVTLVPYRIAEKTSITKKNWKSFYPNKFYKWKMFRYYFTFFVCNSKWIMTAICCLR